MRASRALFPLALVAASLGGCPALLPDFTVGAEPGDAAQRDSAASDAGSDEGADRTVGRDSGAGDTGGDGETGACMPEAGAENQECAAHQPGGLQPFVFAVYCGPNGAPGCPTQYCQPPVPTPVECLCDYTCACILAHCTEYCCQMPNATCAQGSTDGVLVTCNPSPQPACTCDGGTSCWYSISEPPVEAGAPYPVASVVLSPSKSSAMFTATIATPPVPDHDAVWFDLDVSAFTNGGTLTVSGVMGPTGTDGSAFLLDQCYQMPASGPFTPADPVSNVGNVPPGMPWSFPPYAFAAGTTVLHLGTEGSWYDASICPTCMPGATNTNTVTVSVQ